jgi:hypothetical protein
MVGLLITVAVVVDLRGAHARTRSPSSLDSASVPV